MKLEFKYYKRYLLAFAVVSVAAQVCFAQIEFTEHTIADNFNYVNCVYAIDIDGDGDLDVLGAGGSYFTWWENDGEQDFTEHIIADNFESASSVYAVDIDGDSDMDVLGTSWNINDITWWENDGEQDFTEHNLADDFEHASCVHTADVDGDDDLDILASAFSANEITWWENDGEQDFTEHTIKEDFAYAYSVHAADIDGDGDMDVLGAARDANEITWWESDLARSVLNGFVIDLENNQPLEGAVVTTTFGEETITDEDGYWLLIQVRGGLFDLTARMTGYNDSTMIDLELEQDDTLEVIFELLHPTIIPSVDGFSAELKREERTDIDFSIGNEGNGILEWSVGETSDDPWVLRESLNAGETVDDARLSGAVFTDDHFYITGGAVTQT